MLNYIIYKSCWLSSSHLATFDNRALAYNSSPTTWKKFRDDVLVVRTHGSADLNLIFGYLNNLDDTGKKLAKSNLRCKLPTKIYLRF